MMPYCLRFSRCLISVFLCLAATAAPLTAQERTVAKIFADWKDATVEIFVQKEGERYSQGSGFLVSTDGRIVTNYHVIERGFPLYVQLTNDDVYDQISVIYVDPRRDLAIIKINGYDLPSVSLGNSNDITIGAHVTVIGHPEGLLSVSDGIVSGERRMEEGYYLIQLTAPISAGSSGSPVFADDGSVIGVAAATLKSGQNMNYAIPINYVRGALNLETRTPLRTFFERTVRPDYPTAVPVTSTTGDPALPEATIRERVTTDPTPIVRVFAEDPGLFFQTMTDWLSDNDELSILNYRLHEASQLRLDFNSSRNYWTLAQLQQHRHAIQALTYRDSVFTHFVQRIGVSIAAVVNARERVLNYNIGGTGEQITPVEFRRISDQRSLAMRNLGLDSAELIVHCDRQNIAVPEGYRSAVVAWNYEIANVLFYRNRAKPEVRFCFDDQFQEGDVLMGVEDGPTFRSSMEFFTYLRSRQHNEHVRLLVLRGDVPLFIMGTVHID